MNILKLIEGIGAGEMTEQDALNELVKPAMLKAGAKNKLIRIFPPAGKENDSPWSGPVSDWPLKETQIESADYTKDLKLEIIPMFNDTITLQAREIETVRADAAQRIISLNEENSLNMVKVAQLLEHLSVANKAIDKLQAAMEKSKKPATAKRKKR